MKKYQVRLVSKGNWGRYWHHFDFRDYRNGYRFLMSGVESSDVVAGVLSVIEFGRETRLVIAGEEAALMDANV